MRKILLATLLLFNYITSANSFNDLVTIRDSFQRIHPGMVQPKVVYGYDSRIEIYQSHSRYQQWARSTAAFIPADSLALASNGLVSIIAPNLRNNMRSMGMNLCRDERFADQISAGVCSGFLVGPDLLVTAGHCVKPTHCGGYKVVFDYHIHSSAQSQQHMQVPRSSVYSCAEVIEYSLDSDTNNDHALIRLDRPVLDRSPLRYRKQRSPRQGDPLIVIGYPSGLPGKVASGATITSINDVYFYANLDTYGGNSGSAVFNQNTGVVEGILVRGHQDFSSNGSCYRSHVLPDNTVQAEGVTLITNIQALPKRTVR